MNAALFLKEMRTREKTIWRRLLPGWIPDRCSFVQRKKLGMQGLGSDLGKARVGLEEIRTENRACRIPFEEHRWMHSQFQKRSNDRADLRSWLLQSSEIR